MHLAKSQLTAAGLAAIVLLAIGGTEALARPVLVPLSPGVSIPSAEAPRLGHPAINADGTRLAYVHGFDPLGTNPTGRAQLFVENFDGTGLVQITSGTGLQRPESPAFTLNGQTIYFTAEVGSTLLRELFRAPSAGGPVVRLTDRSATGGDAIRGAVPTSDGGAWFAVGSDLLDEGLNLSGGRRVLYRVDPAGTIARGSDPAVQPSREAEVVGVSADQSLLTFSARDPNLGGQRTLRPFLMAVASGQTTGIGPAVGAGEIDGVFSPIGQRLVLTSDADYLGTNGARSPQIFRADIDASTFSQLTHATNSGAVHPGTNADGSLVSFESSAPLQIGEPTGTRRVYVLGSGPPLRRLASGWSPVMAIDGSRVVFVADHDSTAMNGDGSIEIFSATPQGTDLQQHTHYAGAVGDDPHVSADGQRVVFSATGNLDGGNPDGSREIWGAHADGTGLIRLSTTQAPQICREPSLSPDGQWVAFSSDADLVPGSNEDGNEEIFRVRFDGSELLQITDTATGVSHRPRMSTDGRRMVFISTANLLGGAVMGDGRVAFWREATGVFQLLSPPADRPIDALYFSHDGTRVALLSNAAMEGRNLPHVVRIFAASTDGTLLRALIVAAGVQTQGLGLSGDGQWVAAADLAGQILLLPWSGGEPDTLLSAVGIAGALPSVNLDGSRLTFVSLGSSQGFRPGDIYRLDRGGAPTPEGLLDHGQLLPPSPPSLSANGQTVAFLMTASDTLNPDGSREVFAARLPGTAVTWLSLNAAVDGSVVRLSWRVNHDSDHAGFRVVRAGAVTGPWETLAGAVMSGREEHEFVDPLPSESMPWYRVEAIDRHGRVDHSAPIRADRFPEALHLSVGPNPSRGTTWIELARPAAGRNRLDIYTVTGRLIRRLVDDVVEAGVHRYAWNGRDDIGHRVAPGIYFIRAEGMAARSIVRIP